MTSLNPLRRWVTTSSRCCCAATAASPCRGLAPGGLDAGPGGRAVSGGADRQYPHEFSGACASGADRDGAGLETQAAHRRRTHHRPRRDHPGPDPGPDPRTAAEERHGGGADYPRFGHRGQPLPTADGDVRRADPGTGSIEDIFYRPMHPYTRALLRSVPSIDGGEDERLIPIDARRRPSSTRRRAAVRAQVPAARARMRGGIRTSSNTARAGARAARGRQGAKA